MPAPCKGWASAAWRVVVGAGQGGHAGSHEYTLRAQPAGDRRLLEMLTQSASLQWALKSSQCPWVWSNVPNAQASFRFSRR